MQGKLAAGKNIDDLVSLGSIAYVPLTIFYRSAEPMAWLSQLKGRRVAVGPAGASTPYHTAESCPGSVSAIAG